MKKKTAVQHLYDVMIQYPYFNEAQLDIFKSALDTALGMEMLQVLQAYESADQNAFETPLQYWYETYE